MLPHLTVGSRHWMLRRACQGLLIILSLSYLYLCPHSKVEESFSLQATHDLFYYGITPQAIQNMAAASGWTGVVDQEKDAQPQSADIVLPYDHLQYPGVVPRSFVGPAILAVLCHAIRIIIYVLGGNDLADHPLQVQFWARCILLAFFWQGMFRLAYALDHRTKRPAVGSFLLLITAVQFHLPYYASRMLPNTFATVLCLHAYAYWVQGNIPKAAIAIIVTTAVFRCDVILLLFTGGLSWIFVSQQLTILQALRLGIATGIITLAVTVPLDCILWQRLLWPEGEVFFFNTILNKSSEWGISPWHFYISSALPKALFLTLPLVPLSIFKIPEAVAIAEQRWNSNQQSSSVSFISRNNLLDTTWLPILMPAFGFVILYSFLGHKETRFLFPVLPLLNMASAIGLDRIYRVGWPSPKKEKKGSVLSQCAMIGSVFALFLTLLTSLAFVAVSRQNYPGGQALSMLSAHVRDSIQQQPTTTRPVKVHIDVASAMSGVSLFGQRAAAMDGGGSWSFHKSGYEDKHQDVSLDDWDSSFTHVLTEERMDTKSSNFAIIGAAPGHPWLNWRKMRIESSESIFILENRQWKQLEEEQEA